MRKSNVITAILSTASLLWFAPAHAQAEKVTLDYHLPEVKIGFAVSHMITACPNGNGLEGFAMDTVTAIKPVYGRGAKILINPKGNPFVDRQVKLEFYENGTLKSFNGASTGQGGKIVVAAIKAASFAVTAVAGGPAAAAVVAGAMAAAKDGAKKLAAVEPSGVRCKDGIAKLLEQKDGLKAQLAGLKQALISQGSSDNLLMRITRTEAALADTLARLTVSPDPVIWTPTVARNLPSDPVPADLSVWFKPDSRINLTQAFVDFGLGQVLAFNAEATYVTTPDTTPTTENNAPKVYRALVYREPGVVKVTLEPKDAFSPGKLTGEQLALARAAFEATKAKDTVKVPQFGTLKVIRFDRSGIFGSRAVAATFAESGDVTSIGYTSTGGADALAGVLDAAVAAGIEQRDQETNALKREVERRTQANALEALIEAEAKKDAPVPAPAPAADS